MDSCTSATGQADITVRVESRGTPPPSFVTRLTDFLQNNQPPNCTVELMWNTVPPTDPEPSTQHQDTFPGHPRGYQENPQCPALRGENHCPYCLCAPCVILLPPDFLRGSASQHPANDGKRQRLYRMFWRLLSDLGVWRDQEYLARKEARTTAHKKCEMIPRCVITEVRSRYPSHTGQYHDYGAKFEAETDYLSTRT